MHVKIITRALNVDFLDDSERKVKKHIFPGINLEVLSYLGVEILPFEAVKK